MRSPSRHDKLSGFSLPEIIDALSDENTRARRIKPKIRVTDKTLHGAHMLNAVLLWYLSQPLSDRNGILRRGAALYRAHLDSDDPITVVVGDDGAITPERTRPRPSGVNMLPERRKRRKSKGNDAADLLPIKGD
jgi:hypothetical protein